MRLMKTAVRLGMTLAIPLAVTSGGGWVAAQVFSSGGLQQIAGNVFSVDLERRILKLEVKKEAGALSTPQLMDFAITDKTVVTEEDRALRLKDLHSGKPVQVQYSVEGGQNVARSINVEKLMGTRSPQSSDVPVVSERSKW